MVEASAGEDVVAGALVAEVVAAGAWEGEGVVGVVKVEEGVTEVVEAWVVDLCNMRSQLSTELGHRAVLQESESI